MIKRRLPEVPTGMQRIYRRFERWRSSHRGRLPIPEALWVSAATVAREPKATEAMKAAVGSATGHVSTRHEVVAGCRCVTLAVPSALQDNRKLPRGCILALRRFFSGAIVIPR
jgi:hypothetical protein